VLKPQRLPALLLVVTALFLGAASCNSDDSAEPSSTTVEAAQTDTTATDEGRYTVATATKQGEIEIFDEPDESTKTRTIKNPRLINDEPDAQVPLVMLVTSEKDGWLQVSLPVRPNGSTGWVKADDFETNSHSYRIEVNLSDYEVKAYNGDDEIFDAPIGIGTDETPTPGGMYYTTELLEPPDKNGTYGAFAIGLSGHSDVLTTFQGGPGQLGIHGTNQPDKVGSQVSSGCIRMTNENIIKLVEIGMPLGTPVIINA
jgi:lipoprotein-anchoring transpeptidase ErfK/SrfK